MPCSPSHGRTCGVGWCLEMAWYLAQMDYRQQSWQQSPFWPEVIVIQTPSLSGICMAPAELCADTQLECIYKLSHYEQCSIITVICTIMFTWTNLPIEKREGCQFPWAQNRYVVLPCPFHMFFPWYAFFAIKLVPLFLVELGTGDCLSCHTSIRVSVKHTGCLHCHHHRLCK